MDQKLIVASIQMISNSNWQENLVTASKLVKEAASQNAQLAVLPEFFIRIAETKSTDFNNIIEELGNGFIQQELSNIAKENNIYLVAGTIPIKSSDKNKCYNTSIVYDPNGNMICHYHKIHLFKFDNQDLKFDENDTFQHGDQVVTFSVNGFKLGLSICYDLRFPELFRNMGNIDAIILPAAFVHYTGVYHWEVLLRARAIENQCYVIASDQGGKHDNGRHTFGHSMIIDPWGTIQNFVKEGEGILVHELKRTEIIRVRNQLPALNNRKLFF